MLVNHILASVFYLAPSLASSLVLTSHALSEPAHAPSEPPLLLASRREDTTLTSATNDTSTPLNHDGSLNLHAWDVLTDAHCQDVLYRLPRATNPSGTAVCYNLALLDAKKGDFTADLRLYRVSAPTKDWKDVDVNQLTVSVDFPWADVDTLSVDEDEGEKLDGTASIITSRDSSDGTGKGGQKNKLQAYMLKGKIHADKLSSKLSTSDLQVLLIPEVTVTSQRQQTAAKLRAHPSTNEAIFLTGVFSATAVPLAAESALPPDVKSIQEGKIPGRAMVLFPTGLLVTGGWTLAGLLLVGLTVWEKMQFRAAYVRNVEREGRLRRRTSRR